MSRRVSIYDIAREAGVSTSAVSHAFNRPHELSPDVRDRILALAEARGYRPDPRARGLRRDESKLVALIVADIINSFNAVLVHAVQRTLTAQGYHLVILGSETQEDERGSLQAVHYERLAGAIVPAYHLDPAEVLRHVHDRPVVFITDVEQACDAPMVRVPNNAGAYAATSYLVSVGRRRIAHITGPAGVVPSERRRAGYRRALQDHLFGPPREVVGDFLFMSGRAAMEELLESPEPPDGVFVANDPMALGALSLLRERGVRVPDDIAVIGFDNIIEAAWSIPALTTIEHPAAQIGATAATLFLSLLEDNHFRETVDVPCALIKRASA